jgi:exoribonuclease-2
LLYKPDRNRGETKALEAACSETGLSALHLLERCGAIRSAHDYHLQRFLFEYSSRTARLSRQSSCPLPSGLPRADVRAFSIDDAATTEIDDAFSLQKLPGSAGGSASTLRRRRWALRPGSPLDAIARDRLSTVYMPGSKITMLPECGGRRFHAGCGRDCPAVSLYLTVTPEFEITAHESRVEIVPVVANLRHHDLEPLFNEQTIAEGLADFAFRDELMTLWQLANACEGRRGKPSAMQGFQRLQLSHRGRPRRCRRVSRRHQRTQARQPARQAGRRADDRRQQHLGRPARQQGRPAIYRIQTPAARCA